MKAALLLLLMIFPLLHCGCDQHAVSNKPAQPAASAAPAPDPVQPKADPVSASAPLPAAAATTSHTVEAPPTVSLAEAMSRFCLAVQTILADATTPAPEKAGEAQR